MDGVVPEREPGTPIVGIPRAVMHRLLRAALPSERLIVGAEVISVVPGWGRISAVRLGEDFAGICGPETIERFGLLHGGTLTEWASWRWVMYANAALAAPP